MTARRLRLAAYAICRQQDRILLARWVSADGAQRHWTLPGGGVEHGEDPCDAVVREVAEETGYRVQVERLLGVDSRTFPVDEGIPGGAELHSVGVFYRVRVTAGALRHETGGTTDRADWMPAAAVPALERSVIIDIGLALDVTRPPGGHVTPLRVGGLLRH
jgi:8-oxo-dGTP diphosphatase